MGWLRKKTDEEVRNGNNAKSIIEIVKRKDMEKYLEAAIKRESQLTLIPSNTKLNLGTKIRSIEGDKIFTDPPYPEEYFDTSLKRLKEGNLYVDADYFYKKLSFLDMPGGYFKFSSEVPMPNYIVKLADGLDALVINFPGMILWRQYRGYPRVKPTPGLKINVREASIPRLNKEYLVRDIGPRGVSFYTDFYPEELEKLFEKGYSLGIVACYLPSVPGHKKIGELGRVGEKGTYLPGVTGIVRNTGKLVKNQEEKNNLQLINCKSFIAIEFVDITPEQEISVLNDYALPLHRKEQEKMLITTL